VDIGIARGRLDQNIIKNQLLGINPTLLSQGLGGAYRKAIESVIKKYAVSARQIALAFVVLRDRGNFWEFSGQAGAPGKLTTTKIPGKTPLADTIFF